jgi:hypothetical protein
LKIGAFRFVILFTLAAQLAALLFTLPLSPLQGQVTFAPVTGDGAPLFNSLIFLAFPVAGILIVLKFHRSRVFKYFYALGEALLVAFLSFLVLVFSGLDLLPSGVASLAVGALGLVVLIYGGSVSKAAFTLLLSAEAGAYLALAFTPPPTIYFVLLLFALYDYYSVNYGPLKKVVEEVPFGALSVNFGSISMGLGDELFYSMIPAAAYLMSGLVPALMMLAVVDAGVVATLLLLSKRKALPGLTIPLLLALGFFAVLTFA